MAQPIGTLISQQDFSKTENRCIGVFENQGSITHYIQFKKIGYKLIAQVTLRRHQEKEAIQIEENRIFYNKTAVLPDSGLPPTAIRFEALDREKIIQDLYNRTIIVADVRIDTKSDTTYILLIPNL